MQYVVVIADKKINNRYVLEAPDQRIPLMLDWYCPKLRDVTSIEHLGSFDPRTISDSWNVFFAKNEATAKALAAEFSAVRPDKQVFWGKLTGCFESVPSKPAEKVITDKGILPV